MTGRGERAATIVDVAAAAGVSVRTVSRVLNRSPKVGAAARAAIERAIADLSFRPSLRARGLAARRSFLLGVVQDDRNALVVGVLQHGMVEVCSEAGYELLVHPVSVRDPRLADNLRDFVRRTDVDGLILLSPVSTVAAVPALLAGLGVPAVGIAAVRVPGYPAMILTDERAAARQVGDHLVALGHRRLATIAGPCHVASATEREQGFRDALAEAGIALPPDHVGRGDYGFESGLAAAAALLSLPDPPTAIFAANDIMAAAVLKVARQRGVDVLGDLSVAGFDDSDLAAMVTPALTTIRRPLRDLAREATLRLIALIEAREKPPADRIIELDLVVRDSTGPVRR